MNRLVSNFSSVGRILSSMIQPSEVIAGLLDLTVHMETRDQEQTENVPTTWKQKPVSADKCVATESVKLQRQVSNVGARFRQQPFARRHFSQIYLLAWETK